MRLRILARVVTAIEAENAVAGMRCVKYSPRALLRAVLAAFLLAGPPAGAAEKWLRVTSPNFELLTTAGEAPARDAILYFEQVRNFFLHAFRSHPAPGRRVRMIAFQSEKEFRPYRPNESASAFYQATPARDCIVLSGLDPEQFPLAIHEYTHLIVKHAELNLPAWLNEGLADLYSSLRPVAGRIVIGMPVPGRLQTLRTRKWIDLAALAGADRSSPLYNERDRASVFYAESWALTHMLNLSDAYRPRYPELLRLLTSGVSPSESFQLAFAKTLNEVQRDLKQYLESGSLKAAVLDSGLESAAADPTVETATPLQAEVALAEMLAAGPRQSEAKQRYERLSRENPANWEIEAGLARFAWRENDRESARKHYARAVDLGATEPRIYFEYGMLLRDGPNGKDNAERMLGKAVELNPDDGEAQFFLGYELLNRRSYQQAFEHLRKVKSVSPERAPHYFQALAQASYGAGRVEEAKAAAERARSTARTPEELDTAERLIQSLSRLPKR